MDKIFGIPTIGIAITLGVLLGVILAVVVVLGILRPVLVRMGLRNIPRRRAQTLLIIVGLMLASLIITASLGIGDTLSYSFKTFALNGYGNLDISITRYRPAGMSPTVETPYLTQADVDNLATKARANDKVQAIIPAIQADTSITDVTSKQVHSDSGIIAVPTDFEALYGTTAQGSNGQAIRIADLKPGEVLATKQLTKQLNAKPGDTITAYAGKQPLQLTIRETTNLDFFGSAVALMNLSDYQQRAGKQGQVNDVEAIVKGATDQERIDNANAVVTDLRNQVTNDQAAATLKDLLNQPNAKDLLREQIRKQADGSPVKTELQQLQTELAKPGVTADFKKLVQDKILSTSLFAIAPKLTQPQQIQLFTALDSISPFVIQAEKSDAVDTADLIASTLTVLFLVCGLFSIAVGLLLIFLIFIMLAAERKPEMGMARALGIKRRHLTEMFVFEGTVYSAGAALIGVLLGIGVGAVMVYVTASLIATFGDAFQINAHIEIRSLVIAFCLGMLMTFIVVSISAYRVSRLNIVAAIRDLPDEISKEDRFRYILAAPFTGIWRSAKLLGRGHVLTFLNSLTFGFVWRLWSIVWALIKRGPVAIVLGYLLASSGTLGLDKGTYSLGVSLMIVGVGLLVRWIVRGISHRLELADRIGYSIAGLGLVLYWGKPFGAWEKIVGIDGTLNYDKMDTSITLFFISGVFLVAGAIWTIMYNSDILITGLMRVLSLFGRFAPITRTALAYPLQARFRTGMLLAMFSLITFTIIFMSVVIDINSAYVKDLNKISGGWTITAAANQGNNGTDVPGKVASDPTLAKDVEAAAVLSQKSRVQAHEAGKPDQPFAGQDIVIPDSTFFDQTLFTFSARATGYEKLSDRELWQAVKTQPNLAIIDNNVIGSNSNGGFGPPALSITSIGPRDKTFKPVTIELRDAQNNIKTVTIIGLMDAAWPSFDGLYMSQATATTVFGNEPFAPSQFLFKLKPGVDANQARLDLGAAFLSNGLEPKVLKTEIDQQMGVQTGFDQLMQGFLALGLLVGIAGLGVISTRAVVERRQQIGMLRAIGYSRGLVQLSFLLESSFIAILGLILGAGLGILGAYTFLRDSNQGNFSSVEFAVPWGQVILILVGSYLATLITTYLPARAAARIYPAEALRYE